MNGGNQKKKVEPNLFKRNLLSACSYDSLEAAPYSVRGWHCGGTGSRGISSRRSKQRLPPGRDGKREETVRGMRQGEK